MSKYNIILDIDETLIHTYENPSDTEINTFNKLKDNIEYKNRLYEIIINSDYKDYKYYGIKRPHLDEFINFCFDNFNIVAIWSAGKEQYVKKMIDVIFPIKKPHIVFSYDNLPTNSTEITYNKPIIKMIDDIKLHNYMSLSDTYIVDDRKENFLPNPDNGILIPAYIPSLTKKDIKKDDTSLLDIINLFKTKIFI